MSKVLAVAALILGALASASQTAVEQLSSLNQQAAAARKSGDKQGRLSVALRMRALLNGSPASIKAVARAYAETGDTRHALDALADFAAMGQVDTSLIRGEDQSLAKLQPLPEYGHILARISANAPRETHAETAILLSDPGILPEDIAYDPQSHTFLITSILEKKLLRVAFDGKTTEFASSPNHWPIFAIKADPARRLVWATESALEDFSPAPKSDWGRSAVLCFNLETGLLLHRIEGPPHSALGDMTLTNDGTPIVTDGVGGAVYRVDGEHLKLINGKDFISPQTPTLAPDGQHLFVPDYLRGIGILDLDTGKVAWITKEKTLRESLNGVDGLYFDHGALFLTQNGSSPERVLKIQLDKTLTHAVSSQTIERATDTLGDPTHGVVVGNEFYYIANSGWDQLDDHGALKAGAKLTPARIMRYKIQWRRAVSKFPSEAAKPQR